MDRSLLRALGHPTETMRAELAAREAAGAPLAVGKAGRFKAFLSPEEAAALPGIDEARALPDGPGDGAPTAGVGDGGTTGTEDYGLDASADADIARVDPEHITSLEERLDEDPVSVLAQARQFWDAELTEVELRSALGRARTLLERPRTAVPLLAAFSAHTSAVDMPVDFGFEGYDPARLPILPMQEKFETVADAPMYALAFVAAQVGSSFKPKAPFRYHDTAKNRPFIYDMPVAKTKVALLADSGNGLSHARYITKHIRHLAPDHFLYLGDVYYAGTSAEYASFVAPEIEGMLARTNVMMLSSNHEMFSKAYPYFSYLDHRLAKGAPQVQQGSYFCLRFGDAFQIIGVETDYFGHLKYKDARLRAWLAQILHEGRQRGCINVLLSANEPFKYGSRSFTRLYDDLKPFLPAVDLWFWGNTHYCGLFDATAELPVSSCIGHGGYPYRLSEYHLDKDIYTAPCPATPLFLEWKARYHGTRLRPEMGNNGFCMLHLDPGQGSSTRRIELEYIDWTKQRRYWAELGRAQDGRLAVLKGQEAP